MTTENLSLLETKHLVEKSRGKLTMMVLRDDRKFLVSIPEVVDSAPNSEDDRRRYSSSELEGKCRSGKRREKRERGGLRLEYEQYKVSLLNFLLSSLSDISDIDVGIPTHRTSRHPTREKRTRRYAPTSTNEAKNTSWWIWIEYIFLKNGGTETFVIIFFWIQNKSWTSSTQVSGCITSALHFDSASCSNLRPPQRSVLLL